VQILFEKNLNNVSEYKQFFETSKLEINELLSTTVCECFVKYNLKLEATYVVLNTELIEKRAFKTSSRLLLLANDINELLEFDPSKSSTWIIYLDAMNLYVFYNNNNTINF